MEFQVIKLAGVSLAFLSLFLGAEYLYHKKKVAVEKTRKLVHLGSGGVTMLFPILFESFGMVAGLSLGFLGLLGLSKHYGLLPSINAVYRKTTGSYWFPIAAIMCFFAQSQFNNLAFYYLPLLTLTLADPAACFVGKKMPLSIFKFKESQKSIGGSLAFFAVAFSLSYSFIGNGFQSGLMTSLIFAACTTVAEFFGGKGHDNISIPLAGITTLYFLQSPNLILC